MWKIFIITILITIITSSTITTIISSASTLLSYYILHIISTLYYIHQLYVLYHELKHGILLEYTSKDSMWKPYTHIPKSWILVLDFNINSMQCRIQIFLDNSNWNKRHMSHIPVKFSALNDFHLWMSFTWMTFSEELTGWCM